MKGFELKVVELQELRAAHKSTRSVSASDAYKLNAIILLGSGWEVYEVAEVLLLDDETLRSYVEKCREHGIDEVLKANYRGQQYQLNEEQSRILYAELDAHIHLPTDSIIEFIKQIFNIEYSKSGITDLLHRLGYVYKKTKLILGKSDTQAQGEFIGHYKDYMIKDENKVEEFFSDSVYPEHNTTAYGWMKKRRRTTT